MDIVIEYITGIIDFVKCNWQYVVPIVGLLAGFFVFVVYDRKLKNLQIRKLKAELDRAKQAEIKCHAYRHNSNAIVKIVNAGPANASNVRVEIMDKDKLESLDFYHDTWGPYELINASSSVEERIGLCYGFSDFIKLKITWDDPYAKNRETVVNVQL